MATEQTTGAPRRTIGLSIWSGRIAPVFDVSRVVSVVEVSDGNVVDRRTVEIDTEDPLARAEKIVDLGIGTLVCGAVSRDLALQLASRGVRLVPFVSGEVDEVLGALLAGKLPSHTLAMPGCGGRGRGLGRGAGCGLGQGRRRRACGGAAAGGSRRRFRGGRER